MCLQYSSIALSLSDPDTQAIQYAVDLASYTKSCKSFETGEYGHYSCQDLDCHDEIQDKEECNKERKSKPQLGGKTFRTGIDHAWADVKGIEDPLQQYA
jgi:hypothetical protein